MEIAAILHKARPLMPAIHIVVLLWSAHKRRMEVVGVIRKVMLHISSSSIQNITGVSGAQLTCS